MMERILGQLYDFAENGDEYLFYDKKELRKESLYEEGREEERAKAQKEKMTSAKKLFEKDMPIETIIECLNLNESEILELKMMLDLPQ